jgi:hypothetical protein
MSLLSGNRKFRDILIEGVDSCESRNDRKEGTARTASFLIRNEVKQFVYGLAKDCP